MAYLDLLDLLLSDGLATCRPGFLAAQAQFVQAQQGSGGGFPNRIGAADTYYTDFAVRVLALCGSPPEPFDRTGAYLAGLSSPPGDLVEAFCRLNIARVLNARGLSVSMQASVRFIVDFPLFRGDSPDTIGTYGLFLALLAGEMLDIPTPDPDGLCAALSARQTDTGGFAETPEGASGQTNATAAAVAILLALDRLTPEIAEGASHFLSSMQAPDGGLLAHPAAPVSDLLSTFTGALTLATLDGLDRLDLKALARFLRGVTAPTGGFFSMPTDDTADIEYTFYGLGLLAILRAHIKIK
ncbi:MAG: prenyltransferase/squalene oxidase repeat-containing protein [Armatimonadota bacterium]